METTLNKITAALVNEHKAVTIVDRKGNKIGTISAAFKHQWWNYNSNYVKDSVIQPCNSIMECKEWIKLCIAAEKESEALELHDYDF